MRRQSIDIESCRDCANFEERRDIEKVALCAMHRGPSVCCPEFKPRDKEIDETKPYNRFCLNCANFEDIYGIPICARDHRPGVACAAFKRKNVEKEIKA
jgi:hypothetical protein